jgi:hypothetical protein
MGDFEGLYVQAFEQDVDAERALALLQGVRVHEFGGRRAFEMPRHEEGPLEEWYAQVAPRVLVLATRRAILEQALAAPGRPAAVLARGMGFPGDVDWAASIVLLRRYDPDNPSDVTSPLNEGKDYGPATRGFRITSLQMEWVRRFPGGFRVRVATEDEEKARRFFGELLTLDGARYSPGCLRFRGSFGWGSWSGALSLYILFGFNVFI